MAGIRRPVVLVAVAFAHVVLLYLLAGYHRWALAPAVDNRVFVSQPATVSLWLPPVNSTSETDTTSEQVLSARARPSRGARPTRAPQAEQATQPEEPTKAAEPNGAAVMTPPNSIDWYGEAPSAASHALSGEAEKRRQAAAFAPPQPPPSLARPPPAGYRFGWNEVTTQRFRVVNGVPVFRVNEHCIVAVPLILLASCTIGKIARRGDLFQHMHDPPPEGQADLP